MYIYLFNCPLHGDNQGQDYMNGHMFDFVSPAAAHNADIRRKSNQGPCSFM